MSSSMETIGHKLQSLEERLQAANQAVPGTIPTASYGKHQMVSTTTTIATTTKGNSSNGGSSDGMASGPIHHRQPPNSFPAQTTSNRPKLIDLPVNKTRKPAEIETDRKLLQIESKSGVLTIRGKPYFTHIREMEHLGDLGNGTSGNVVKMLHKPSGEIIAVKQMRRTGCADENKRILMDLDVVLKSHDCKYIVQCLGCFVRDADVWICMELMSMCFDKLLKLSKKPVPEDILGKVTVATANALAYLKENHDVIHRDVKPSNILIDEHGNIKLCDFGISGRLVDSKANTRSAGCAAYMAPERIDPNKPKYDIRADVWSLGITLVELATAKSPYHACKTDFEVLTKVLDSDPPALPRGDGYNFSEPFHDFVRRCLTKDCNFRPKYAELLNQPFIKIYEEKHVDVAQWFMQTTRANSSSTVILTKNYIKNGLTNNVAATTINNSNNSNNKTISNNISKVNNSQAATTTITHIPTYQQKYAVHNKKDEAPQSQQEQQQQQHHQYQQLRPQLTINNKLQQQQKPIQTQLPQHAAHFYGHQQQIVDRGGGSLEIDGGAGSGGSSSASTSASPLSPPSISYQIAKDQATLTNEMHNLYRKSSPFLHRKYNNGTAKYKYTDESPKKESMFSSFGQTILRNLTTSPFSQKKHTSPQTPPTSLLTPTTPPTPNIDPLWRMPVSSTAAISPTATTHIIGTAPSILNHVKASDECDAVLTRTTPPTASQPTKSPPLQNIVNSPAMARKLFQDYDAKFVKDYVPQHSPLHHHQQQPQHVNSLIPINKHDAQQRVAANHSPILLQRFYHQQNQLREKELERQKQQLQQQHWDQQYQLEQEEQLNRQHQQRQHEYELSQLQQQSQQMPSAEVITTNPFLSTYIPPAVNTTTTINSHSAHYKQHQQQQYPSTLSHIPIAATNTTISSSSAGSGISSSHSTSSQSSTQSLKSQIQQSTSPQSVDNNIAPAAASRAFGGVGAVQLHYQPLPQQYVPSSMAYNPPVRQSRTPPTNTPDAPDTHAALAAIDDAVQSGNIGSNSNCNSNSRLHKFYAMRTPPTTNAAPSSSNYNGGASAASKDFRTHAEHANGAATTTSTPTASSSSVARPSAAAGANKPKSLNYFQRTISASSSSNNTSSSTSPTECVPNNNKHQLSNDFHDGGTSSFLRRYAVTGGGGSSSAASPHVLANLDRRHRSPDPPPRYNRGQSPLLLRKNLLELSGQQQTGSPLLNRRYVSASPPLPPPRRGSESVPGSPQHFRTRIHYTPEPQRRIYRTIDQ